MIFSLNATAGENVFHCSVTQIVYSNKNILFKPKFAFNFMQNHQRS